jgi:hypothetical protein
MDLSGTSVVMTAWRRPGYLRRVLQSWAAADGAGRIRFTIGLDPSDRQAEMLAVINEAREQSALDIQVRENPERYGVLVNPWETARRVFRENHDTEFLIFAEEDLLVSDDVLRYFYWADERFRYDSRVLAVCAHTAQDGKEDADQEAVEIGERFRCWIWGTWRDRWEEILEGTWDKDYSSAQHKADGAGWDYNIDQRIIPRGGYKTVLPLASRSQNIGRFEGVHADPSQYAATVNPSFRSHRGPVSYRLAATCPLALSGPGSSDS